MILFKLCNLCNIWFTRLLIYSAVRERVAAGTRLCSSILTLAPLQPVDNYFVYVISDLISAFVNPAEYLRYGETVSTWSRLKQKRAFISRHAQTQFIHAIYGILEWAIFGNFDVAMISVLNVKKKLTIIGTIFEMWKRPRWLLVHMTKYYIEKKYKYP